MSDFAELAFRLGVISFDDWQNNHVPSKETVYAAAGIPGQADFQSFDIWLIWRLKQMGAGRGSAILIRTGTQYGVAEIGGLHAVCMAFGLEQVEFCLDVGIAGDLPESVTRTDSAGLGTKPRWAYDFILDVDRADRLDSTDTALYARIGAGGVLYVGTDAILPMGKRWHDLASGTEGFCLRQRLPAPFFSGFVEEFWSLDN